MIIRLTRIITDRIVICGRWEVMEIASDSVDVVNWHAEIDAFGICIACVLKLCCFPAVLMTGTSNKKIAFCFIRL